MKSASLITVVVSALNESDTLPHLIEVLSELETNQWGDHFEFVVVDDGSTDDTWQQLLRWSEDEPRLSLVRLAGNRGPHRAGRAGLEVAAGDAIVFLPADLQEGTDLVDVCLEKWHQSDCLVVMMVAKRGRKYDRATDGFAARLFYAFLRLNSRLHRDVPVQAMVKLMDHVAADAYLAGCPATSLRTPFVLGQKFPHEIVNYEVQERTRGKSKWRFRTKVALMIDLLVECAAWLLSPWRIAVSGGLLHASLSLLSLLDSPFQAQLAFATTLCFAITMLLVLSVLGIHVGRIHQELRGGPPYVIRESRRGTAYQGRFHRNDIDTTRKSVTSLSRPYLDRLPLGS